MSLVLNRLTGERDTLVMFGGFSVDCVDYCDDLWHYNILQVGEDYNFTKPIPHGDGSTVWWTISTQSSCSVVMDNVCRHHFLANLDLLTRSTILK